MVDKREWAVTAPIGGPPTLNGRGSSVEPIRFADQHFSRLVKCAYSAVDAQRTVRGRHELHRISKLSDTS
jgi:hypothetical protein